MKRSHQGSQVQGGWDKPSKPLANPSCQGRRRVCKSFLLSVNDVLLPFHRLGQLEAHLKQFQVRARIANVGLYFWALSAFHVQVAAGPAEQDGEDRNRNRCDSLVLVLHGFHPPFVQEMQDRRPTDASRKFLHCYNHMSRPFNEEGMMGSTGCLFHSSYALRAFLYKDFAVLRSSVICLFRQIWFCSCVPKLGLTKI